MSVKIIRGGLGPDKTRICMEEIRTTHEHHPNSRCIMLVPDHYSFETEKKFVDTFGGLGINGIEVMTPRKMAIAFLPSKDLRYLTESGKQMLISRAVREYCDTAPQSPLIRTMKTPGFTQVMETLISEMKRYCVTPEMLLNGSKFADNDTLRNKLTAFSEVYKKYNEFFEEGSYTDSSDDLLRVAQYISISEQFNENLYVWVDKFDEFLPHHMEVLRAMASRKVNITISISYLENDDKYDSLSEEYARIKTLDEHVVDFLCDKTLTHIKSDELHFLLENFYNIQKKNDTEPHDIMLFEARDSYAETEHTASEILRLVREEGYRYRDITVMCGDGDGVSHIIKAVFDEYGIPYFSDEKITLSDHPIAMQLLSVFDLFNDEWSYASVMRYLRAGFIYDKEYTHINQSEIDRIDNFALRFNIRGRRRWLDDEWVFEKNVLERVWDDKSSEKEIDENLNSVRKAMAAPLKSLHIKIKKSSTAREYAMAVFEFLEDINMYGGLKKDVVRFRNSGKTDEAQQFSEIWNLIIEVIDQSVATMGDRKITFSEYGEYIKAGLAKCEIRTIPSALDSVCVGSVERSTATPIKALFVTGAVSGTYPSDILDGGFLSNSDRSTLKEKCGVVVAADTKSRMNQQYFKVYKSIAPVTDKLFLSYHIQSSDGKGVRPARLIIDIKNMFPKLKAQSNVVSDCSDTSYISAPSATLHKLLINKSRNGANVRTPEWQSVYRWFKNDEHYSNKLHLLEQAADYENYNTSIKRKTALDVFGNDETVYSASRLNTYASCPFSYFLQYGLNAKEEKDNTIEANDFGTYAHRFIQELCMRVEENADTPDKKANNWKQLTDAERDSLIKNIADETKEKIKEFKTDDENRQLNMIDRIEKTVKGSARVVHKSIKGGRYIPIDYEREFEKIPLGDGVYIKGAVDRVDSYADGNDEYVRIIDYKSGSTGFNITDIYNKINMQMVIYAVAMKKTEEELKHRNIHISGIFYNKVRDDFVKGNNPDEANHIHTQKMSLDGVVFAPKENDDRFDMDNVAAFDEQVRECFDNGEGYTSDFMPLKLTKKGMLNSVHSEEECDALLRYVTESVKEIDKQIKNGEFDVSPYKESNSKNSCTYCPYKETCIFEREECQMRERKGSDSDIWDKIVGEGGKKDGMDE